MKTCNQYNIKCGCGQCISIIVVDREDGEQRRFGTQDEVNRFFANAYRSVHPHPAFEVLYLCSTCIRHRHDFPAQDPAIVRSAEILMEQAEEFNNLVLDNSQYHISKDDLCHLRYCIVVLEALIKQLNHDSRSNDPEKQRALQFSVLYSRKVLVQYGILTQIFEYNLITRFEELVYKSRRKNSLQDTRPNLIQKQDTSARLSDDECQICGEAVGKPHIMNKYGATEVENPVEIPCGHVFGENCINRWVTEMNKHGCPMCRMVFSENDYVFPNRGSPTWLQVLRPKDKEGKLVSGKGEGWFKQFWEVDREIVGRGIKRGKIQEKCENNVFEGKDGDTDSAGSWLITKPLSWYLENI